MTVTLFTADLHLGHQLVAGLRDFASVEEHDRTIMDNLVDAVGTSDTLWVLGDISSGGSAGQRHALALIDEMLTSRGRTVHLIAGNHDGIHPLHRNALKWDAAYRQVFTSVQPFARRRLTGRTVWLSHFPWKGGGDHTEHDRYETVRLGDDGTSWLLHGHTHSSETVDRTRRQLHVGLDAWGLSPVPVDTVADLIGATHDESSTTTEPAGETA